MNGHVHGTTKALAKRCCFSIFCLRSKQGDSIKGCVERITPPRPLHPRVLMLRKLQHTISKMLISEPRPVSMHENDQVTSALSKVSTEPVLGEVSEHAEPSASCPCDVDKALCNTPKYAETWQPSCSRLHAASIERDMRSVEIDCILTDDADDIVSARKQVGGDLNQMEAGGDNVPLTTQAVRQDSNAIVFDAGASADAAPPSEDATDLLSSADTGNDSIEERIEMTSLDSEASPLNTQMAETSNQIRDLLLLLRTQVAQLGVQPENLDLEADIAQVGPQTLTHNHHRTQEEYLFEARSSHEGTHRPHAPKLQSLYY